MSRVLKFRAWDSATGKVSEPFDVKESWGDYLIDFDDYSTDGALDSIIWEQFTGLSDRNGEEIYEGDIVKYKLYADSRLDYIDEVFYSTISGAFMVGDEDNIRTLDCLINVEVIGNVHEPPKDFRPEHLKRMGVSISKGGEDEQ